MKHDQKLTWFERVVSSALAFLIGGAIILVAAVVIKGLWPVVRFIATKAWALVRRKRGAKVAAPFSSRKNALPTPDIFKGAPNLAPAKQLKL